MANVFVILLGFIAVLLGLYYNQSIPDSLPEEQHSGIRFFAAMVQTYYFLDFVTSSLGIGKKHENFRQLTIWTAKYFAKEETSLHIEDTRIANVPVRVYRPKHFVKENKDKRVTGVIYFHGGGWMFGSVEMYHPVTQNLVKGLDVVLVSVDYRLAPETTFPGQYHDCIAVVKTLLTTGEQYGIDTNRIVIGGDSAGGNLAAAVAIELKNEKKKPAAQILIYPTLQFTDLTLPSYRKQSNIILDSRDVATFWSVYLTGSPSFASSFLNGSHSQHLRNTKYFSYIEFQGEDAKKAQQQPLINIPQVVLDALTDYRVSPLMADNLKGLPTTLLVTCEFDVLKDDGLLYKTRLLNAGIKVAHFNYMTYHHFLCFQAGDLFVSQEWLQAMRDIQDFIKEI